jgi:hypothetical protein
MLIPPPGGLVHSTGYRGVGSLRWEALPEGMLPRMEGGAAAVPGGLLVAGGEESGAVQLLDAASGPLPAIRTPRTVLGAQERLTVVLNLRHNR